MSMFNKNYRLLNYSLMAAMLLGQSPISTYAATSSFDDKVGIGVTNPSTGMLEILGDEQALIFDNGEAMITVHDGYGNFNILSGLNGNNITTANAGGSRLELSDTGAFSLETYSGALGEAGVIEGNMYLGKNEVNFNNVNIGIGSTAPSELLHIQGAAPTIRLTDTNTNADNYLTGNSGVGGVAIQADQNNEVASSYIDLYVDGTRQVRVTDTGDVGIGDTTPDASLKLDVEGQIGATEYCDQNGANCVAAGAIGGGDNLGNHTATANINVNDRVLQNTNTIQGKDYDDNTGGTDNKYRLLYRDGAHMFYNGGVAVGAYPNGTWTDLADGYLVAKNRLGVGITSPTVGFHTYHATTNAQALFQSGDAGASISVADDSGSGMLYTNANGDLRLYAGGTAGTSGSGSVVGLTVDGPTKYVGIGTTSPTEELYVTKSQANPTTIVAQNSSGSTDTNTRAGFTAGANGGQLDIMHYGSAATGSLGGATKADAAYIRTSSTAPSSTLNIGTGSNTRMNLFTNEATRVTILGNGNVGIGDTSPSQKLEVGGNINATGSAYFGDSKELIRFSDAWLRLNPANNFTTGIYAGTGVLRTDGEFQVNANGTRFVVETSGEVGIGTSNPAAALHINGAAANIILTDSDTGADAFLASNSSVGGLQLSADANNEVANSYVDLAVDGSTRLRVTATGDVGIGDTTPDGTLKLDVNGNIGANNYCDQNGNNCTAAAALGGGKWLDGVGADEIYYNAANVGIGTNNPASALHINKNTPYIRLQDANNVAADADTLIQMYDSAGTYMSYMGRSNNNTYLIARDGSQVRLGTNNGTDLAIDSAGEVGIGTTSPNEELHVLKSQANPTTIVAGNPSTSNNTNTRAGFSAVSNGAQLDIATYSAAATGTFGGSNKADGAFIRTGTTLAASGLSVGTGSNVPLKLFTSDATRMTILGNGNVGIGNINPSAKLDVTGSIESNSKVVVGRGSGSVAMTVNDGEGNANLAFNHESGVPDSNGNAARITVNTDSSTDASMIFEVRSGVTSGTGVGLPQIMRLGADKRVGIGITSPTESLVVKDTGVADNVRGIRNIAYRPHLTLEDVSTDADDWQVWADSGSLEFLYGDATDGVSKLGTAAVTLTSANGNMGIGTGGPSEPLHIQRTTPTIRLTDTNTGADNYVSGNSSVGGLALQADQNNEVAGSYLDLFVDGNRYVRVTETGDVGIGDASPDGTLKLDVAGNIGANNYCDAAGNNCTAAAALGGGKWLDGVGANEIYYNAAFVGIGTNNPARALHISKTLPYIRLQDNDNVSASADAMVEMYDNAGTQMAWMGRTNNILYLRNVDGDDIRMGTGNSNDLTIEPSGDVGIGTTTPAEELTVIRSQNNSPTTVVSQNSSNGTGTNTRAGFSAVADGGQLEMIHYSSAATGTIGGVNRADAALLRTISGSPSASLNVGTGGSVPLNLFTNDATRVTVAANGNVGIGTVPSAKLHVEGSIRSDGNRFYWGGNDSGDFFDYATQQGITYHENGTATWRLTGNGDNFINGGNVGIGDSTPSFKLDVNGSFAASYLGRRTHSSGHLVGGYNNIGASSANTNPIFTIGTNYNPTDTALGNMYGVGYTSGSSVSFVTGSGSGWGMYVASDGDARTFLSGAAGGNSYINSAGGNVGIRTASPTHALHVNGQARIPEVIFAPTNNGAADKSSIVGGSGAVQIFADSNVDFYESDNNTRAFRFELNNGDLTAQRDITSGRDIVFTREIKRATQDKCITGEVVVGFNSSGMICEEPVIIYN